MNKTIAFSFCLFCLLLSCDSSEKKETEISKIKVEFEFIKFHTAFFNSNETQLRILKKKYPYLFPTSVSNEQWLEKIIASDERTLFEISDNVFPNLNDLNREIKELYQHIKFYKPDFKEPKTFTLINDLDYENAIIYADSLAFISLDMYLGSKSEVYHSFPEYISENYTPKNITVDLATKIIEREFQIKRNRSFIESMVFYGKKLYLTRLVLPKKKDHLLFGVTEEKYIWAIQNEEQIWKYFVSNNMLFSTDISLNKRFIDVAPFSKFYLENDKESPGRIGTFIGLNIIKSFMQNNNENLSQMLQLDAETILQKSKYKPRK